MSDDVTVTRDDRTTVSVSVDLALAPIEAFAVLVEELSSALARAGMGFEVGASGRVTQGELAVGHVVAWQPGVLFRLEWRPADWQPEEVTEVELRLAPVAGGTPGTLGERGRGGPVRGPGGLAGRVAGGGAAP